MFPIGGETVIQRSHIAIHLPIQKSRPLRQWTGFFVFSIVIADHISMRNFREYTSAFPLMSVKSIQPVYLRSWLFLRDVHFLRFI